MNNEHFTGPVEAIGGHIFSADPDAHSKRPDGRQCIAQIVEGWETTEAQAIAERMALAWNMHDALLAACKLGKSELDWILFYHGENSDRIRGVIRLMDAAIAKAKGEPVP